MRVTYIHLTIQWTISSVSILFNAKYAERNYKYALCNTKKNKKKCTCTTVLLFFYFAKKSDFD